VPGSGSYGWRKKRSGEISRRFPSPQPQNDAVSPQPRSEPIITSPAPLRIAHLGDQRGFRGAPTTPCSRWS